MCLVTQSYLTLYDPMDSSQSGPPVCGDSPGKYSELGCHALLQGIFPTQRANPCCRQILYCLSHQWLCPTRYLFYNWLCIHIKATFSVCPTLSFPLCPQVCSLSSSLYSCHVNRLISTVFVDSIYMHSCPILVFLTHFILYNRYIHFIPTYSHLFLFMAEWYSIVYMHHNFLIHSSVDEHLGCFYVLVIVNSAAMNTEVVVVELLSHVWLFCDPMDCSLLGSFVHGILQARILE